MENMKIISCLLSMLDQQLFNCLQSGAIFLNNGTRDCVKGGDERQNVYYKGNYNLADYLLLSLFGGYVIVDENGKHHAHGTI